MKRWICIVLTVCILLSLCGCEFLFTDEIKGYIRSFSFQSNILVLNCAGEDDCCFLVTDQTELLFGDILTENSFYNDQPWDHYLRHDMYITVKRGEKVPVEARAHYQDARHFYTDF